MGLEIYDNLVWIGGDTSSLHIANLPKYKTVYLYNGDARIRKLFNKNKHPNLNIINKYVAYQGALARKIYKYNHYLLDASSQISGLENVYPSVRLIKCEEFNYLKINEVVDSISFEHDQKNTLFIECDCEIDGILSDLYSKSKINLFSEIIVSSYNNAPYDNSLTTSEIVSKLNSYGYNLVDIINNGFNRKFLHFVLNDRNYNLAKIFNDIKVADSSIANFDELVLYVYKLLSDRHGDSKSDAYKYIISSLIETSHIEDEDKLRILLGSKSFTSSKNSFFWFISAELSYQSQDYLEASKKYQKAISLLKEDIPQFYFDRLKKAIDAIGRYPANYKDAEIVAGDRDKHEFLQLLHKKLKPNLYVEIGVESGKSLALAECKAYGIDPMPRIVHQLNPGTTLFTMSSDAFFQNELEYLRDNDSIDLGFIDGMHLFEFLLRDFINVEKNSCKNSLIVIDDILPNHSLQAQRIRVTRAWTGDVWKVQSILKKYRPDLHMLTLNIRPTGLLLITNLDPTNTVLADKYNEIIEEYLPLENPPEAVLSRDNVISGFDNKINEFICDCCK